jgi:hypothetical protein
MPWQDGARNGIGGVKPDKRVYKGEKIARSIRFLAV